MTESGIERDVGEACAALRGWIEAEKFKGYDPYDALNSPLLKMTALGLKWPRIAVIQAMKRSPVNLRPCLLVKKGYNPKGLGLFLWSYAKLFAATGDEAVRQRAFELLDLLAAHRSPGTSGNGWGYNFDWQSRAFYVPKGTPTIVNSSFIGHALLDAYDMIGDARFLEMALPIKDFLLNDLHRSVDGDKFCFSYTPIDEIAVHNANLLGASLLIRLNHHEPTSQCRDAALASLEYSMAFQHEDGSWWYAEPEYQHWIDSFHTGFNLQSIRYFLDLGEASEHRSGYERGVEFYVDNFFEPDGTAKYFHDRALPEDIHSYAQAMVFFSGMGEKFKPLVESISTKMLNTFQDPAGYFYFQRRKGRAITIPYIRWAQSWAFHALSEFVYRQIHHDKAV